MGGSGGEMDVGCGGLWQDVIEENGTRMGENSGKNWTKYQFFPVPFPICPEVEDLPHSSLVKASSPYSSTGKWEFLPLTDTHRHGA